MLSAIKSWKDFFPQIFFQGLGTFYTNLISALFFFCTILTKYLKHTLKTYLEKLRKNGGFALFNTSLALHEKPYFPSPGISWKARKDHVNIIFPSTFWLNKGPYFPSPKSSK